LIQPPVHSFLRQLLLLLLSSLLLCTWEAGERCNAWPQCCVSFSHTLKLCEWHLPTVLIQLCRAVLLAPKQTVLWKPGACVLIYVAYAACSVFLFFVRNPMLSVLAAVLSSLIRLYAPPVILKHSARAAALCCVLSTVDTVLQCRPCASVWCVM
jgi:hypothetical protein